MRSKAFSCLAGFSSCRASELYSSMVFWREASEAEREPRAAGVRALPAEEGAPAGEAEAEASAAVERGCDCSCARSLRIAVLCFRALLKIVFWRGLV